LVFTEIIASKIVKIGFSGVNDMPMVVQPLRELQTLAILFFARTDKSLWSIFRGSGSSRNGCATFGMLQPSQRDMPMD
jgi:hypothetical protein